MQYYLPYPSHYLSCTYITGFVRVCVCAFNPVKSVQKPECEQKSQGWRDLLLAKCNWLLSKVTTSVLLSSVLKPVRVWFYIPCSSRHIWTVVKDRSFTADMNVEMSLHFFCTLSTKPQRMDVYSSERKVIIIFFLREGQLRQSNSALRVLGRLGGEQPGLSVGLCLRLAFSSGQKPTRDWRSTFTILQKKGFAIGAKALTDWNSCITSLLHSGKGNTF